MKTKLKLWLKEAKTNFPWRPWYTWFTVWFWSLLAVLILTVFIVMELIIHGVIGFVPKIDDLQNPKNLLATEIISSDGVVIGQYYKENRVGVKYEDISPYVIDALIATEDVRFEQHTGVDGKSLFRAIVKLGRAGGGSTISQQLAKLLWTENVGRNPIQRATQKPTEWVIATNLERLYSKEEIITMYLNRFDFLNNAVGLQSAARIYFSSTPKDLKLEEAALLVGMCKNPSMYNPRRFQERSRLRRNTVLDQMAKYGKIDQATCDSLKQLPLELHFQSADHKQGLAPYFREYLRVAMTASEPSASNSLARWRWENDPLYGFCEKYRKPDGNKYNIYRDGLKIYTTIDSRMQRYAEEAVREHMTGLQKEFDKELKRKKNAPYSNLSEQQKKAGGSFDMNRVMMSHMTHSDRYLLMDSLGIPHDSIIKTFYEKYPMQVFTFDRGMIDTTMTPYDSIRWRKGILRCGFMAMDPITGHVKAYVGGPDFSNFQFDMCTTGRRQVGSTIKPYLYTLAMDEGMWPCDTIPYDSVTFELFDGQTWTPRESHIIRQYKDGPKADNISLTVGLQESSNWASAYLMSLFTPEQLVTLMRSFGIKGQLDPVVSLSVGPCEVSVEEMVDAYTAFANKGIRTEPLYVTRIEDANGNIIAQFSPKRHEIISETTAYKMVHMLRAVVDKGTGVRMRSQGYPYRLRVPMGGKTGTSNENADGWFMCFTPSLVSGAWCGGEENLIHFDNMRYGQGANSALPICALFLKKVYNDNALGYSEDEQFDIPVWFDPNEGCEK